MAKKGGSSFQLVRPHCAGIDLGSTRHYAGVLDGEVRSFGVFTCELEEMGSWLLSQGVKDVVMESTGVYWMPVYEVLERMGLKVALVDGRAAKALPGRKTDVQDCQWICQLHAHGLLSPCMVPEGEVLELRAYWRQRARLVEQRAEQIQLMQKALEQMNLQLHKVLSDIAGVSGMAIMRAILAGERDSRNFVPLLHGNVKASRKSWPKR